MPEMRAWIAVRSLVTASMQAGRGRYDRTYGTFAAIHDAVAGGSLSRTTSFQDNLDATRRRWEKISEALSRAASAGQLRIEQAPPRHTAFVLNESPETVRDLSDPPPNTPPPAAVADWAGVAVHD